MIELHIDGKVYRLAVPDDTYKLVEPGDKRRKCPACEGMLSPHDPKCPFRPLEGRGELGKAALSADAVKAFRDLNKCVMALRMRGDPMADGIWDSICILSHSFSPTNREEKNLKDAKPKASV